MKETNEKGCASCRWYAPEPSVCCNGDSEHCADFVDEGDGCPDWEKREET